MKISWYVGKKFGNGDSSIFNSYLNLKELNNDIRLDIVGSGNYHGNVLPSQPSLWLRNQYFKHTKFRNFNNYLWCKKHPVDILHVQHASLFKNIIDIFGIHEKPVILISLHGSDTYVYPHLKKEGYHRYKNYSAYIDGFVVQSNNQKSYLKKFHVENKKIFVIPTTTPKEKYNPKNIQSGDKIKILTVGRFTWEKNYQDNLRFIKRLVDSKLKVEYTIIGTGTPHETGKIHYLIDKFNLNGLVTIKDPMENKKLKEEYLKYNYYLLLSISESGGRSIMEALQRGLVPILSNVGGIPELADLGEHNIICDYFDVEELFIKFSHVNQNPDIYRNISERGICQIDSKYNSSIEAKNLLMLYEKLLNKKSR